MGSNSDLHRRRAAAVPRGVANSLSVYVDHAKNAELWDVEGRRYIDFASGISVLNIGHLHPRVVAAVQQQMQQVTNQAEAIAQQAQQQAQGALAQAAQQAQNAAHQAQQQTHSISSHQA